MALGKSMAKAAAIGAVIAIPVPFVGPILGAAAGAGYAYYKAKRRDRDTGGMARSLSAMLIKRPRRP